MIRLNNILVVAAHPDDELLGVGGTIRRLVNEGAIANAVILAEGITSRANRREEADMNQLVNLRMDAKKASEIVGYSSIELYEFPDNRMDSIDLLDVIKVVSRCVEKYKPDIIFTHHHGDLNIDHRKTCEAVLTACRPSENSIVKWIYAFETPSSTEWNYEYAEPFTPNFFVNITDTITSKIDGMACYESESAQMPHPRSEEALRALAGYRGASSGFAYAEAFSLLRGGL